MFTATGHRYNIYERKKASENGLIYVKTCRDYVEKVLQICVQSITESIISLL
jgi:hypothetical protein